MWPIVPDSVNEVAANPTEQRVITDEKKITDVIFNRLHNCDGDALAHVVEILTGLPCSAVGEGYTFFIDDNNREDFESIFGK